MSAFDILQSPRACLNDTVEGLFLAVAVELADKFPASPIPTLLRSNNFGCGSRETPMDDLEVTIVVAAVPLLPEALNKTLDGYGFGLTSASVTLSSFLLFSDDAKLICAVSFD